MVRDANGAGRSGASGRNADEARWMVAQIAQKSSASFAGWCAGFCWEEGASDAATLVTAGWLASASRWMCPNESTSCSATAASASQLPHRLLVRTQRISRTVQYERKNQSTAQRHARNTIEITPHWQDPMGSKLWRRCNRPILAAQKVSVDVRPTNPPLAAPTAVW